MHFDYQVSQVSPISCVISPELAQNILLGPVGRVELLHCPGGGVACFCVSRHWWLTNLGSGNCFLDKFWVFTTHLQLPELGQVVEQGEGDDGGQVAPHWPRVRELEIYLCTTNNITV